jgi:integrase
MPTLQEEKKIATFQRKALSAFKVLIKDLKSYSAQAKSEHKGRGKDVINKRKRHIVKSIEKLSQVESFMVKWVGSDDVSDKADSWRRSSLYLIRDYLVGQSTLRDISSTFEKNSIKHFKAIEVHKKQKHLKEKIPSEFRAFLPPMISIEVDSKGHIKEINDLFGNKTYTLSEKIKNQKKLVRKYNAIVKKVQKDMKSEEEMTKLSAVITSLIMETGIRPGQIGNGVVKTVEGKEVNIETFGATTLTSKHIKFVRSNFAELKFEGKKGTVNTASVSNKELIKVIKDYVDNALSTGSDYIFVTSEGRQYTYQELLKYFRKNFKGFKITDFRKLRATQEVFDALNEERSGMLKEIKEVAKKETKEVTEKVVKIIANTINKAHDRAQIALNHESGTTTQQAYINPEVLFRFLSSESMQDNLKDCVLSGKTKLHFDPLLFIREAQKTASRKFFSTGSKLESLETIIDILEHLFDDDSGRI